VCSHRLAADKAHTLAVAVLDIDLMGIDRCPLPPQVIPRNTIASSLKRKRQTIDRITSNSMGMHFEEIMDELSHAFLLEKMKRELDTVKDPEELRRACVLLIDLMERQKGFFKQMLYQLIDEDPEVSELFE
jgi:hypothetical protein